MLKPRLMSAIVLIPLVVFMIWIGGLTFAIFVSLLIAIAAWEFWRMFHQQGHQPSMVILVAGSFLLILSRYWLSINGSLYVLAGLILLSMAYHTIAYQQGADRSATDFCITLGGLAYLGILGGFFISLRELPGGLWWIMLTIPAMALGDAGAYMIGRHFGRHKMLPRVSPHKTWEGYIGGVAFSTLITPLLALLWGMVYPTITPLQGVITGAVISTIAPLGDFGESMLKREFGVKDSSGLIPGHGGVLDRLDSLLWAGVIGYFLVLGIFLR